MCWTPSGEIIGAANDEVTTYDSNGAIVDGFYGDATPFGTSTPAFTSAAATYATTPAGDVPQTGFDFTFFVVGDTHVGDTARGLCSPTSAYKVMTNMVNTVGSKLGSIKLISRNQR